MKRFNPYLAGLLLLVASWLTTVSAVAQPSPADSVSPADSMEFALVTCSPHEEVYSLYGHTALGVRDLRAGHADSHVTFNWGIFNYDAPYFVLRFIFGLTDYELGVAPFDAFCAYYRRWGSSVTEQVLNLTPAEKARLSLALSTNYEPEHRVYRYNYFYDNCSTRPRNILEACVDGHIEYAPRPGYAPTFRQMIHQQSLHHRWNLFGIDLLLGLRADRPTTRQEQEFLPGNLLYDFDHATVVAPDGHRRPLVVNRRQAVRPGVQVVAPGFLLSPTLCFALLLAVSLAVAAVEWQRERLLVSYDAVLMTLTGLAGVVLLVMVFSQHPCTSLNLQLLLVNPLHLVYVVPVFRRRRSRYWCLLAVMLVLFLAGAFFQHYAEGLPLLALCLLSRLLSHYRHEK